MFRWIWDGIEFFSLVDVGFILVYWELVDGWCGEDGGFMGVV